MRPIRALATTVAGFALMITSSLAGCSPGSPSSPAARATGTSADAADAAASAASAAGAAGAAGDTVAAATAASADPDAGLRAGAELRRVLPTPAELPPGFRVPPDGPQDSGTAFGAAPLNASPPGRPDCGQLEGGNAWVTALGQPPSFAQTEFTDSAGDQVLAEVDTYRHADARTVMAGYRAVLAACRSFAYAESGTPATVSLTLLPPPKLGDESLRALLRSPTFAGGVTVVAVRVGQHVLTVYDNSATRDLGAGAVGLATAMVHRVAAQQ